MRKQTLCMLKAGASRVARRFNVHLCWVSQLLSRSLQIWSLNDRPRPGQPFVTAARQQTFIGQRYLRNKFTTTGREIIWRPGRHIHHKTVSNVVKRNGLQHEPHCIRYRLQWTRQHLTQRQSWSHVVFSNQSSFRVSNADCSCRVYRRLHYIFAENCVYKSDMFEGGGVLVWDAINHTFRSQLQNPQELGRALLGWWQNFPQGPSEICVNE